MLHIGTLVALLALLPRATGCGSSRPFLAALRDRSLDGDPDRRLAALLAVATVPALSSASSSTTLEDSDSARSGSSPLMLVVGGGDPVARRADRHRAGGSRSTCRSRRRSAIGGAQALALIPGISRSGISISAGLFAGLRREEAARFSFLMATPITAAAAAYEMLKVVRGEGVAVEVGPLAAGLVASFVFGLLAIAVLLRFLRTRSTDVFVAYRVVLAAAVLVWWLGLGRRPGRASFDTRPARATLSAGRTSGARSARSLEFFPSCRGLPAAAAPVTSGEGQKPVNNKPTYLSKEGLESSARSSRRCPTCAGPRSPRASRRQGARRHHRERRVRGRQERAGVRRGPDPDPLGADQERRHHRREPLHRPRPDRLDRRRRERRRQGDVHDRRLGRGRAGRGPDLERDRPSAGRCSASRRATRSSSRSRPATPPTRSSSIS